MSIKRKLILIGICIAIIIVVFTVNVMRKIKEDELGPIQEDIMNENVMSRAEAYRLLSYLNYDKAEREAIPIGITYANVEMSDWYDTYVNAVWKMGLIEGNVTIAPTDTLTYGTCKQLIDNLIIKNPEYQVVYGSLSFDFSKAEEDMLIPEFLELYQAILDTIPKEELKLKEETLFVLGRDITEDGIDRMVTDLGKYYYLNAKSYEEFLKQLPEKEKNDSTNITGTPTISLAPDAEAVDSAASNSEDKTSGTVITEDLDTTEDSVTTNATQDSISTSNHETSLIDQYLDKGIKALVCDQEIVYIKSATTQELVLHNVWIKKR